MQKSHYGKLNKAEQIDQLKKSYNLSYFRQKQINDYQKRLQQKNLANNSNFVEISQQPPTSQAASNSNNVLLYSNQKQPQKSGAGKQ